MNFGQYDGLGNPSLNHQKVGKMILQSLFVTGDVEHRIKPTLHGDIVHCDITEYLVITACFCKSENLWTHGSFSLLQMILLLLQINVTLLERASPAICVISSSEMYGS